MAGEDVYSWSTSANNNANADVLINWAEGQPRASVNNSARSMMAALAKAFAQINGAIVTTGSPNAQLFSSGVGYGTIPNNFYARLRVGSGLTNTGATTLAIDGLGAVPVLTATGAALSGGEFPANGYVEVLYNGTNWIWLGGTGALAGGGGGGGGGGGAAPSSMTVWTVPGNYFYNRAATATAIIVECIGAGGGGGGTSGINYIGGPVFTGYWMSGGGGGGGGYSRKILQAADFTAKEPIVCGQGGAGGPAQFGQNGGATQFGSAPLCKAFGGSGGSNEGNEGGAGGDIGIGDLNCTGSPGEAGIWAGTDQVSSDPPRTFSHSGAGGSSFFGGGAAMVQKPSSIQGVQNGLAGRFGGGGSGGFVGFGGASLPASSGGTGGHGLILITEFGGHGTVTVS